jgi:hypothetical protein
MQKVDTDTATIVSLWAGVGGFVVGLAGIALTLYSFYKDKPSEIVLTGSGWMAALLCAIVFGYIGRQFVRLAADLSNRVAELQVKLAEQLSTNQRLIEIDAYVINSRGRARAAPKIPREDIPKEEENAG